MTELRFPLGQEQARFLLAAALDRSRLGSAYLLGGPRGVGKATAARWLAAQILSRQIEQEPEAQKRLLAQIQAGTCPDLVWVEPGYLTGDRSIPQSQVDAEAQNGSAAIRIEQAVGLRRLLQSKPSRGRWVVVIEEADLLTPEAGNALLKLLEDRRGCTFILTAQAEERVLDTIRSRTQRLPFVPLDEANYRTVIQQHCPALLNCPQILRYGAGAPGEAVRAYQLLTRLAEQCPQIQTYQPQTLAEGVLLGLSIARTICRLPLPIQQTALSYLQHHLVGLGQLAGLPLMEQALSLLECRLQAQGVWELLLSQCALKRLGWQLELPQAEKPNSSPPKQPNSGSGHETLSEANAGSSSRSQGKGKKPSEQSGIEKRHEALSQQGSLF